jgi:hypothetical protein
LEFNNDDFVSKDVKVENIGGFCIDLSHFKKGEISKHKNFTMLQKEKNIKNILYVII